MRWEDERYVRLYTRDTVDWNMWPWQSRALFPLLLRKVDRAGILELGKHGVRGLADAVKIPAEVVEPGLTGLLEDGCVEQRGTTLVMRSFIEAQEANLTDAQRKRDQRERDRARKRLDESVTQRDSPSQGVTKSHTVSHEVTSGHSDPCLTVPSDLFPIPAEPVFDFEAVYSLYPRKEGKKKGLQRCRSQIKTRSKYDALLRAVKNYAAGVKDVEFAKHFDTFMGCWEDYVEPVTNGSPSKGDWLKEHNAKAAGRTQ